MIRKVFSIRDAKVAAYNLPFKCHTEGEAIRMLLRAAQTPQHEVNMFPQDFDLFELGTFDDNTGKYQNLEAPLHIGNAKLLMQSN